MKQDGRSIPVKEPYLPGVALFLVVLGLAALLKFHFSKAGSEELAWILGPLAWTVDLVSGMNFQAENGAGYVSGNGRYIIAPECAGINFMIAVLLTGAAIVKMVPGSFRVQYKRIALIVVTAYLFTVIVNSLRIVLAMELYTLDIYSPWCTAERVHRVVGILLYFPALLLYGLFFHRQFSGDNRHAVIGWSLLWYLWLSLGIPLVTGSFQDSGLLFYEHGLTVILSCSAIVCICHWFLKLISGVATSGSGKLSTVLSSELLPVQRVYRG